METPVLKVKNLKTKLTLGNQNYSVVDGISFNLFLGKTLALVGESGCGKTMTALSILRVLPTPPVLPPEGEVIYKEKNILQFPEKKMRKLRGAKIAMIFQDPTTALNPVYTIGDQLNEVAELHLDLYGNEAAELAIKALKDVGIPSAEEILFEYPHQLSGGMKQRVMIAMALMCEPDILIADEPTTALDVTIQAQVLDLIKDLQVKKGMALLLITHDMGIVAEMADDVIVMYASQDIERGNVRDIFEKMSHPYTMGLFASRPEATKHGEALKAIKGTVPSLDKYPEGCRFNPRCPFRMEKCRKGEVTNFIIIEDHSTKCWLHDGTEESKNSLREHAES